MSQAIDFLQTHWLPSALALAGVCCVLGVLVIRRRQRRWSAALGVFAAALALLSLGGFCIHPAVGFWLGLGAIAGLFLLLFLMVLTGAWWSPLAWSLIAIGVLGAGGIAAGPVSEDLAEAYRFVRNL